MIVNHKETKSQEVHLDLLLQDYAAYHQTRGNKICHFIGIPLIIFGILDLLQKFTFFTITSGNVTLAELTILAGFGYYLTLNVPLAVAMFLFTIGIDAAAMVSQSALCGGSAFIVGWIFQTVGHAVFEKNRPAFFRNLVHLLIGPLFLLNEVFGIRKYSPQSQRVHGVK